MQKFIALMIVVAVLFCVVPVPARALHADDEVVDPFRGKVISILGDSISTFAGYIPVDDGFNMEHFPVIHRITC